MKNIKNKEQIFSSLRDIITKLENNTEKYLSGFDMASDFSFSDDEKTRKKHLRIYNKFSLSVKMHIEACEQEMAMLSLLICEADKSCNKKLTEELTKKINLYLQFSASVSHFIKKCEVAFLDKENKFHTANIANQARELLSAIQNYKQNI